MAETVVAVFGTHSAAIHGVEELRREGFQPEQISIFAPDPREVEGYSEELGIRVIQAGGLGVAAGGTLGGLIGWVVGLTGLVVPGAGLIIAAGPLAATLVGLVGGASLGGFVGTLVGLGLPHSAAAEYERALREGQTIVMVHPGSEFALAGAALNRAHPFGLHHYEERIGALPQVDTPPVGMPSSPTGRVEPAAPDRALNPNDVSVAIEGQHGTLHTQYLDDADLHAIGGSSDTR